MNGDCEAIFRELRNNLDVVKVWEPMLPEPTASRCEQSRHRTLAHLRACQEQWLIVAQAFAQQDAPRVTILHPWRHFEANDYAAKSWEEHLAKFIEDRETWLSFENSVDLTRGGAWNRKPDTIMGLATRLANHETYHIELLKNG